MMRTIYFTLLLALPFCGWGQDIVHIAGNYDSCTISGYSGDGKRAYYAGLNQPLGICRDAAGNLYIGDHNDPYSLGWAYVRKIEAATGIITTIAGGINIDSVTATDTLSNIPATNAFIFMAAGLCIDHDGNLLIADGLSRVLKVSMTTGIMTIVAGYYQAHATETADSGDGGPATNATIGQPYDVAVDSANNIYIACPFVIRRIDAATGIISTIAGADSAGYGGDGGPATGATFNGSIGIYVDKGNNIFVADNYNYRVRMISAATNTITTVVGGGGASGEGSPATASFIGPPMRVTKDDAGNLFISTGEYSNGHGNFGIQKVDTGGIISVYAGGDSIPLCNMDTVGDGGPATAAYLGPWGICTDSCGDVFFTDNWGCSVRAITAPGMGLPEGGWLCGYNILKVGSPGISTGGEVFRVWPNPVAGRMLNVNISSAVSQNAHIIITDLVGERVDEMSVVTNRDTQLWLNVASGVYFITAWTDEGRYSRKVVVE